MPVRTLAPPVERIAPALSMPVMLAQSPVLVRSTALARVMPPESSSAAVMPPMLILPVVSWLAAEARTTPALTLNWPDQPELSAPSTRVPVAILLRAAVAPAVTSNGAVRVTVLPAATSSWRVLAVLPRTIVRPKDRSSVKRRKEVPPPGTRTTLLAGSPSWPSAEMERPPRWMVTSPTKSLSRAESTRVPLPVLVRPAPETLPAKVSP